MPETPTLPDRARTPLLTLITQESLDEDYQHVAQQRSAAGTEKPAGRGRWTAAAVVVAFGLLVSVAAVQTSQRSGVADANRDSLLRQINQRRDQTANLQKQIIGLREVNLGQQKALSEATGAEATVTNRVDRLAAQSGFGPVSGPGVVITVDDAPNGEAVRAKDLRLLVNGLWEAGAEAISINGKRLTGRSALFNSGEAINLNGAPPLSPPYVVSAIGDRDTLEANLLDTSTGLAFTNVADALGLPVTKKSVDDLELPAATQRLLRVRHAVKGAAEDSPKPDRKDIAP
jgi:uncharacterized protein YlxW (UPF0749 family)